MGMALEGIMTTFDEKLDSNNETNKVISSVVAKLRADVERMSQSKEFDVSYLLTAVEKKIDTFAGNMLKKVDLNDAKLSEEAKQLQTQVETLQDCVLTQGSAADTTRPRSVKAPECPYCMEELRPPAPIFQCLSGHLICEGCKDNPTIRNCPSCHRHFRDETEVWSRFWSHCFLS